MAVLTFVIAPRLGCSKGYPRSAAYLRPRQRLASWPFYAVAASEKGAAVASHPSILRDNIHAVSIVSFANGVDCSLFDVDDLTEYPSLMIIRPQLINRRPEPCWHIIFLNKSSSARCSFPLSRGRRACALAAG